MGKIFKNMLPYWKAVIIIIALLFVQAWCDLSLPSYTSDIIDVGIQNSGVEHIVPEKLTKSEFKTAQFIMTDDEADLWKGLYKADGEFYKLKDKSSKELDEADENGLSGNGIVDDASFDVEFLDEVGDGFPYFRQAQAFC